MVPFPVILSDPSPRFQGHGVIFMPIDALNVLSAQLTCDLFAIATFLFKTESGPIFRTLLLTYLLTCHEKHTSKTIQNSISTGSNLTEKALLCHQLLQLQDSQMHGRTLPRDAV